jgi:hypothetical protein
MRGGSVHGGSEGAFGATGGGKAVAEGAVLEGRDGPGVRSMAAAAVASFPGTTLVLRRCELRIQGPPSMPRPSDQPALNLMVAHGARATAADCACGGPAVVMGQGSVLLHSGLAFPPGEEGTIAIADGGVARELPAAAGAAAAPRAGAAAPPAAPLEAGSRGEGTGGQAAGAEAGEAAGVGGALGSLALGGV